MDGDHTAVLVVNGEIEEEALTAIRQYNAALKRPKKGTSI